MSSCLALLLSLVLAAEPVSAPASAAPGRTSWHRSIDPKDEAVKVSVGAMLFVLSYLPSSGRGAVEIDRANRELAALDPALDLDGSRRRALQRQRAFGRRVMVPVIGPFAAMGATDRTVQRWWLGIVGIVEVAAVALIASGAIRSARHRRQRRIGLSAAASADGAQLGLRVAF